MLEKYKVFVRGSTETKKILGEIVEKRSIIVNLYENSDNPEYQFGKCPIFDANFNIWYTNSNAPMYFKNAGYKEVTPEQFRKIWLEEFLKKENESEAFCCKGCEKLREVCQRLAEEGFVKTSDKNFEKAISEKIYFFEQNHRIAYYTNSGRSEGEIVSPEEFYERITGKPWKEMKKYLGFIGDSDVKISLLPTGIKNPKNLKGTARTCIFYIENNELTYCPIGKEPEDISFEIVSYDTFLQMMYCSLNIEPREYKKLEVEHPLSQEDCFETQQETKETNFVQSFVKNPSENFLQLSEEKPLKIIL